MKFLNSLSRFFGRTFAIWVILCATLAFYFPSYFKVMLPYVSLMLGIVMFGMGLTLKAQDFSEVFRQPGAVLLGTLCQFILMPGIAWLLCLIFNLDKELAVGVILVGCCPGGTASNVMAYLAKGDVALSVTITSVSTLLAPIVTPALIYLLAHQWVDIQPAAMCWSICQIVILPIVLGLLVRAIFKDKINTVVSALPTISVLAIVGIASAVVAASQQKIAESGMLIFCIVVLHNLLGLGAGYLMAKIFGWNLAKCKTLSIEVGMQNSGLGAALATAFFSPVSAVPSALFSVWHNISGPILATYFRGKEENPESEQALFSRKVAN